MVKPVIFILGVSALPLAQKLKEELGGEIHAPNCVPGGDVTYTKATAHLAILFREGRPIIGLCASGILIRAFAAEIRDKHSEPPVIAVAEDGSSAVPLLGGHHGANELARRIAEITNGHAAITTASEVRHGFALDEPAAGYVLANPHMQRPLPPLLGQLRSPSPGESRTTNPFRANSLAWPGFRRVTVKITEHARQGDDRTLIYHPRTLAIGIGCERGTSLPK